MLRNYLRIATRTLRRQAGYTLINLAGLAAGLACCLLILLYVRHELSYDRFHANAERVFQIGQELIVNGEPLQILSAGADLAEALVADVPVVEAVVQTKREAGLLRDPDATGAFEESAVLYASARFFEVFSFPLRRGDPATALAAPGHVVLSETTARKLFGDADPVGRPLLLEPKGQGAQSLEPIPLRVTGVAADAPGNATIQFDLVVSGATEVQDAAGRRPFLAEGGTTYVLTRTPGDRPALETGIAAWFKRQPLGLAAFSRAIVTPLPALHLTYAGADTFAGRAGYLYVFSGVALVVLLIACINYVNLATACATRRAKEVGVRKALGASRGALARQFLFETLLLTAAAGTLALGLVEMGLPAFNRLFDVRLAFAWASEVPLGLGLLGLIGLVGLLAGSYPAFYLSRFRPAAALKGTAAHGRGGARLRQALVVAQFAATVALLAATGVIYAQLRHAQARDLGFDGRQVLTLDLNAPALRGQRDVLRQAMAALPGIRQAALSSAVPGHLRTATVASPAATPDEGRDDVFAYFAEADPVFPSMYGLGMAAGRFFAPGESRGVVLNETAARRLGVMTDDPAGAVGRTVYVHGEQEVIGVVKDFHVASLHEPIAPVALLPLGAAEHGLVLSLRLQGTDLPGTLAAVEQTWKRLAPYHPFAYRFVDDAFDALYRADRQLGRILGAVAGVAVLLACFGLFGLAAFAAERRTKEIGIRKVLGASAGDLVVLLSREFVALVLVGAALATPVAGLAMHRWLQAFAYRIDLPWPVFAAAALAAVGIALLTVSYQAVRAALADPVRSLRQE